MAPIHSVGERRHPACTPNSLSECEAHHKLKGGGGGGSQPSIICHVGGPVMSRGWRRTCPWCYSTAMLRTGGSPQAGELVPQEIRSYTVVKVTMPVFLYKKLSNVCKMWHNANKCQRWLSVIWSLSCDKTTGVMCAAFLTKYTLPHNMWKFDFKMYFHKSV